MSLVGFKARNHQQQVGKHGANKRVDDRSTSPETFDPLQARFRFTLDAAASEHNAKLADYYTLEDDGLSKSWAGERVWCNPPYSDISPWVEKAWAEVESELVVLLLPANRTEQGWWQEYVEPWRDRVGSPLHVEFLRGRLRFDIPGGYSDPRGNRPPFGCCLLIWNHLSPGADRADPQPRKGTVTSHVV